MALRTDYADWIDLLYRPSQYTNTNNLTIAGSKVKPYCTTTITSNVVFKLKDSDDNKFCFKCILNNFEIKYKNKIEISICEYCGNDIINFNDNNLSRYNFSNFVYKCLAGTKHKETVRLLEYCIINTYLFKKLSVEIINNNITNYSFIKNNILFSRENFKFELLEKCDSDYCTENETENLFRYLLVHIKKSKPILENLSFNKKLTNEENKIIWDLIIDNKRFDLLDKDYVRHYNKFTFVLTEFRILFKRY